MDNWPKDHFTDKMAFYGDFRKAGWASMNLIHINPPFKMFYEKQLLTHGILVHKKCGDAFMAAFSEIWDKCGKDQIAVDKTGASNYGGCFNIRLISGSENYSNHSWACAIDLSPETNGFNMHPTLGNVVVNAFDNIKARWGGRYLGRKDPMHFELVSPA